jgi:hypothetical protein
VAEGQEVFEVAAEVVIPRDARPQDEITRVFVELREVQQADQIQLVGQMEVAPGDQDLEKRLVALLIGAWLSQVF